MLLFVFFLQPLEDVLPPSRWFWLAVALQPKEPALPVDDPFGFGGGAAAQDLFQGGLG